LFLADQRKLVLGFGFGQEIIDACFLRDGCRGQTGGNLASLTQST